MATVNQILQGVWGSFPSSHCRLQEEIAVKGNQTEMSVYYQTSQVYYAQALVKRVIPISGAALRIAYLVPLTLGVTAKYSPSIKNHYLQWTVHQIHAQIGTLCQLASLAASISLIYYGQLFFGASAALFTLFGFLQQSQLIPNYAANHVVFTAFWITQIARLIFGGWESRIALAADFTGIAGSIALQKFINRLPDQKESYETCKINSITHRALEGIYYEVNRVHIHIPVYPIPPAPPKVDLSTLSVLFSKIEWTPAEKALAEHALAADDTWSGGKGQIGESEIDYLKRGVEKIIQRAKSNTSLELTDRMPLQRLVAHLAVLLPTLPSDTQTGVLITLGTAGHYCDFGHLDAAYRTYFHLQGKTVSLPQKILRLLGEHRVEIFKELCESCSCEFLYRFFESSHHWKNVLLDMVGNEIGHPDYEIASTDTLAHKFPKWPNFYRWLLKCVFEAIWEEYKPIHFIEKAINGKTGADGQRLDRKISIEEVSNWAEAKGYKYTDVVDETGKIKKQYLLKLLCESGVLLQKKHC